MFMKKMLKCKWYCNSHKRWSSALEQSTSKEKCHKERIQYECERIEKRNVYL